MIQARPKSKRWSEADLKRLMPVIGAPVRVVHNPDDELRALGYPKAILDQREAFLVLDLPLPPSINNGYWIPVRKGKLVLSNEAKAFYATVANCVMLAGWKQSRMIRRDCLAKVVLHLRPEGGDTDNRSKPIGDALQYAGVVEDDKLIARWEVERGEPVKDGRLVLRLEAYHGCPPAYCGLAK
jgi:Holliday junction resolvase RusA-like endonuclease